MSGILCIRVWEKEQQPLPAASNSLFNLFFRPAPPAQASADEKEMLSRAEHIAISLLTEENANPEYLFKQKITVGVCIPCNKMLQAWDERRM